MSNGTISKTKEGYYRIRYMKDGVRRDKTLHVKTITEAKAILNQLISEVNNNTIQDPVNMTFYELTKLWLDNHAVPNLSPTTVVSYKTMLNKEILPVLGDMKITSINKIHIQEIINSLKEQDRTSKTIRKYVLAISAIFNYALEMDFMKYNPAATIKIRNNSLDKKTEMKIYDHDELDMLFKALDSEPDKVLVDMILIDLYTGLRRGELMGLMPKDYNPSDRTLTISRNRVSDGGTPVIKDTKTIKLEHFFLTILAVIYLIEYAKARIK